MNKVVFILVCPLFGLFTGCASIVGGVNEPVSVETTPEAATCSLKNDKGEWFVNKTPGSVTVHRSYQPLDVQCKADGYQVSEQKVKSTTKAMAAGNLVFGGLVGVGVDVVDGAAYQYPQMIKLNMAQLSTGPTHET